MAFRELSRPKIWTPADGEFLEGTFEGRAKLFDDAVGMFCLVRQDDGELLAFKENGNVRFAFSQITTGQRVQVTYCGKTPLKGGKTVNTYRVLVDDGSGK